MSEPLFFERPTRADRAGDRGADRRRRARRMSRPTGASAGIAPLDRAGPGDLAFLQNPKYAGPFARDARRHLPHHRALRRTGAGRRRDPGDAGALPCLRGGRRRSSIPARCGPSSLFEASGVSTSALVHPTARLENGVMIDPAAVIGPRAEIGAGTVIGPAAVIGPRGAHRARLRDRRRRNDRACADRRPRDHPCGRAHRAGRLRLPAGRRAATARSRRSGASSSRTTSRSAPTRPSTAARSATP